MYKIAEIRYFYAPDIQGQEAPRFWGEYETVEEAQAAIDKAESQMYYLEHNEYARPTLLVVDEVDADLPQCDWSEVNCEQSSDDPCGECYSCIHGMIEQGREYLQEIARGVHDET